VQAKRCALGRNRTADTRFRRAVLYPLSYEGLTCRSESTQPPGDRQTRTERARRTRPARTPPPGARDELAALPVDERRAAPDPARLRSAGMTWEAVAGWLQGPMDAAAWTALIPTMGYVALLRNLRNFDEAGVPDDVASTVAARLAGPEQVARSTDEPRSRVPARLAFQCGGQCRWTSDAMASRVRSRPKSYAWAGSWALPRCVPAAAPIRVAIG
jgi:TROVE domain